MPSTFHGVNTAYSGLKASQRQVETTSHNISNANNPYYTRQRAVQTNANPLNQNFGDLGQGTNIVTIKRVHDDFVYERYKKAIEEKEASGISKETLKEIANYFPDMDELGIYQSMGKYFESWSDLSSHPTSSAHKEALKSKTDIMVSDIVTTRAKIQDSQVELNKQIEVMVNEVNSLVKKIAEVNLRIREHESGRINNANDLRDERDKYEMALSKILDIKVYKEAKSDSTLRTHNADWDEGYVLNIAGFTVVDEQGSHEIKFNAAKNPYGFGVLEFVRFGDLKTYDITNQIRGGKIGAMLELRGRNVDHNTGEFTDGQLQGYIDNLDTFAKGLIESTNNTYAKAATSGIRSNKINIHKDYQLTNSNQTEHNIKNGEFDLVVYDASGAEISRKTIDIDNDTTMKSLVNKINSNSDDNDDSSPLNDVDDEFEASYVNNIFSIKRKNDSKGYTIGIEDNKDAKTNIAGALGLNRYLDGHNAKTIQLNAKLRDDSQKIYASLNPHSGDSEIANDMQQLQYDNVEFIEKNGNIKNDTLSYYYNIMSTKVATDGDEANSSFDTKTALFNTIKAEFDSISKVSMDEELTELMKFQTAYQANAKVMNTINTVLDSLLGIKN